MRGFALLLVVLGVSGCATTRVKAWQRGTGDLVITAPMNAWDTQPKQGQIDAAWRQANEMCRSGGYEAVHLVDEGIGDGPPMAIGGIAYGITTAQQLPTSEYFWRWRCSGQPRTSSR